MLPLRGGQPGAADVIIRAWTGREVLALRDQALRMTQEEFAERAKLSVAVIGKYERAGTGFTLGGPYAKIMEGILDDLNHDQFQRFRLALSDGLGDVITLDAGIDGLEAEEVDLVALTRRGFIVGLSAGAAGLGSRTLSTAGAVPAPLAEGMRATAATYRAAYRMAPARQLLAAAHGHLQLVLALRPGDQAGPIRDQLLLAVGEMATLSGTVLGLDLDRWNDSAPYFTLAAEIAHETENHELQTVVMACRAFQAAYGTKDLQLGLDYAEAATATAAAGASTVTRGWAAAVASERQADLGNHHASMQLLDQARAELEGAPGDDRPYSGIGSFDDAKLIAYEGGNYRRLGKPDRAVATLGRALERLDPSLHRHRATALIDRAEAQYDARRIDAACADARAALKLVANTHHANSLERATTIARSLRATKAREANDLWNDLLTVKASALVARR